MIDFHSHILPAIDDGAQDIETALEMLRISYMSGVSTVVSTSHCYPTAFEDIEKFIKDRDAAYNHLQAVICNDGGNFPNIIKGSEVHLSRNLAKLGDLDRLCIEDTNYILLEMPYEKWTDDVFEDVYQITRQGLRPIIAHLDRYISQEKLFLDLLSLNVLCQINASSFYDKKMRKKMLNWFAHDTIHVIGSDMHNLTSRPPNLAEAYDIIENKYGWEYVDFLKHNSERITKNQEALPTRLPKLSFIKKIKL